MTAVTPSPAPRPALPGDALTVPAYSGASGAAASDGTSRSGRPLPAVSYLCHGVVWPGRVPHLHLAPDTATGVRVLAPLVGAPVGLRVDSDGRRCLGRLSVSGPVKGAVPCPDRAGATTGTQCAECAVRDEFRFAHHAHRGGHVPPELGRYLEQPHWVYVATFADTTSKVGTAADPRKLERLDEQGAVRATYVARVSDGLLARVFEDAVTSSARLSQVKHRTAKTAALTAPASLVDIDAAHAAAVTRAGLVLAGERDRSGVSLPGEEWLPPEISSGFFERVPLGGWARHPHVLHEGEHGFTVHAVVGSVVLASLEAGPAATADANDRAGGGRGRGEELPRYVLDLAELRGRRVTLGAYRSVETLFQSSLF